MNGCFDIGFVWVTGFEDFPKCTTVVLVSIFIDTSREKNDIIASTFLTRLLYFLVGASLLLPRNVNLVNCLLFLIAKEKKGKE